MAKYWFKQDPETGKRTALQKVGGSPAADTLELGASELCSF